MIAKLEWTQRLAQQDIEHLRNPTMGMTMNNEPLYYPWESGQNHLIKISRWSARKWHNKGLGILLIKC